MKSIMFKTKIFHEGKMYLLVSDVTKLMEISEKAFCKKYSDKIVEIPGCRKCIAETDFNLLISDDKELFKKMGMLEVTKVETLDANPSNNMWRNMKSRKNLMKHYSVL